MSQPPIPPRRPSGFASMDPQRRREVASKGGTAASRNGLAHRFTSEEGRAAARKRKRAG